MIEYDDKVALYENPQVADINKVKADNMNEIKTKHNNLYSSVSDIDTRLTALSNKIYPVGSIYLSVNNTNPEDIFGGTWEQIKDTFLLGAGDTYEAGSTGGSATHRHNFRIGMIMHWFNLAMDNFSNGGAYSYSQSKYSKSYGEDDNVSTQINGGTTSSSTSITGTRRYSIGDTDAESSLPPYLTVYMWKRIA